MRLPHSIRIALRTAVIGVSCACLLPAQRALAQPSVPDTAGLRDAVVRAQAALTSLRSLWGIDGSDVQWILSDRQGHVATERAADGVRLVPITLPVGTVFATSVMEWGGRRYAMVLLPLPKDQQGRTSLLVHEAMHTFQPEQLPRAAFTEAGEGGDLLETDSARAWLFLELRALASAMTTKGEPQRRAAEDALVFRARRDALAKPRERERLDGLDLSEGLPEYTGWRLGGATADSLARRLQGAQTSRVSWVRATGYWTGPAYGFVLDQMASDRWRSGARAGKRLPELLADALGVSVAPEANASRLALNASDRWRLYSADVVFKVERMRAESNAKRLDELRAVFMKGKVLRVVPKGMQVAFDPNGQTSLGADGTVMRGFRWAGADGAELVAQGGALVSPQWDWVQVPLGNLSLPEGVLASPRALEGAGWKLSLPAGWKVTRIDGRVEVRPP